MTPAKERTLCAHQGHTLARVSAVTSGTRREGEPYLGEGVQAFGRPQHEHAEGRGRGGASGLVVCGGGGRGARRRGASSTGRAGRGAGGRGGRRDCLAARGV